MAEPMWWLASAEDKHASAPRRFFIPPRERRDNLAIGRTAKLLFEFEPRDVDGVFRDGERMWVEVVEVGPDGSYVGRLANQPHVLTELSYGDPIEFTAEQVIAIEYAPAELGYDPHLAASIDARLVKEDRAPQYVIYAQPPGAKQSFWFAALDKWPPAQRRMITVGELTDRWPELADVFASGGGCWERVEETASYRQTDFPAV